MSALASKCDVTTCAQPVEWKWLPRNSRGEPTFLCTEHKMVVQQADPSSEFQRIEKERE